MDKYTQTYIENLRSQDRNIRYQAFLEIQTMTNEKVDWTYEIWDVLKNGLSHPDNHQRAIAAQLLRKLYDKENDETIKQKALDLIETEEDQKYRKKYATVWRK